MSKTYKAEDVDPLLADLYGQVEASLEVAKSATLRLEALEAEHRVTLEKVASMQKSARVALPEINPRVVDETLQQLEDLAIIKPEGREKIASDLASDPNNALRFMSRVLTLSAEAHSEGGGLPKSASTERPAAAESDPDGWNLVIEHGA